MLPDALIVCLPSQKMRGNSNFSWRLALLFYAKSARIFQEHMVYMHRYSLRHGNGLSALLLLTRAAKSSAAKSSASKTRSMESRLNWEAYRKQRRSIRTYFAERCTEGPNSKDFWTIVKPFFLSNRGLLKDSVIILSENNNIMSDQNSVSNILNNFYVNVAKYIG